MHDHETVKLLFALEDYGETVKGNVNDPPKGEAHIELLSYALPGEPQKTRIIVRGNIGRGQEKRLILLGTE